MSLHLGNLSSRLHRDELERVFRRFGRCKVQLKDGFGFVVYDFPANAEKALRALRGKNICGEPVTISWSNRQPRPLQRFARGPRSHETQQGRKSARGEDYVTRKLGSNGRRDYRKGFKHPDGDGGRLNSTDMMDEVTSYHQDNIKEYMGKNNHNFSEALSEKGGTFEPNLLDNDRWGEQVGDPSDVIGVENGLEFDRYEPYRGDDRRDGNENNQETHSGDSPALRKSQEKTGRDQTVEAAFNRPDGTQPQQACYICGELGHKMRNCPQESASRRKKLSRFDRWRNDEINFREKGEGDLRSRGRRYRRRLQLSRDAALMRRHKNDEEASGSRKHRRLIRSMNSPIRKGTQKAPIKDYREKKRSRRESGIPERHHVKRARGHSSSIHSDYTESGSHSPSQSSRSLSGSDSGSKSRLESSRRRSQSSRSRSVSTSQYSKSGSYNSRPRLRSVSPTSLSLSVSIGTPLPSSPNKTQINQKGSLVSLNSPESKAVLVEQGQQVHGGVGSEKYELENMMVGMENENAAAPFKIVENMDINHPKLMDDDKNYAMSGISCEVKNSVTPLLEKGDYTTGSLSPQRLRELSDLQNSDVLVTGHMLTQTKKPDSDASVKSRSGNLTSISPEELYKVLKHYGLEHPKENDMDIPVEAYFGSARLWPWEIIYYKRLRKGPISTENYAQRIAQNKEFGIVDKYIRSSSGWGEMGQDNS